MEPIQLYPYQQQAVLSVEKDFSTSRAALLDIATGGGKTIIFTTLCREILTKDSSARICILAHQDVLVQQAADKLLRVWPEARFGIACNNISPIKDFSQPITIGSIQTLASYLQSNTPPLFTHFIIDEVHRLPPKNQPSQYKSVLDQYTNYQLLGVSGTPFRTVDGKIYEKNVQSWFDHLTMSISVSFLQKEGFLTPYRIRVPVDIERELQSVPIMGDDYSRQNLGEVMGKERHLQTAYEALLLHAAERQHIAIYAVNVSHAEALAALFAKNGEKVTLVHSKLGKKTIKKAFDDFESGKVRILVSVDMLTTGWDSTAIDCICGCRPTMSLALHLQMCGRGLRLHPGKKDCLILDLAGNVLRHGTPRQPVYSDNENPLQGFVICPACTEANRKGTKRCRACGEILPASQARPQEKDEGPCIQTSVRREKTAKKLPLMDWKECGDIEEFLSKGLHVRPFKATARAYLSKFKANFIKVEIKALCDIPVQDEHTTIILSFPLWFQPEGKGMSKKMFAAAWNLWGKGIPPKTGSEFLKRQNEMCLPASLWIKKENGYFRLGFKNLPQHSTSSVLSTHPCSKTVQQTPAVTHAGLTNRFLFGAK